MNKPDRMVRVPLRDLEDVKKWILKLGPWLDMNHVHGVKANKGWRKKRHLKNLYRLERIDVYEGYRCLTAEFLYRSIELNGNIELPPFCLMKSYRIDIKTGEMLQ